MYHFLRHHEQTFLRPLVLSVLILEDDDYNADPMSKNEPDDPSGPKEVCVVS